MDRVNLRLKVVAEMYDAAAPDALPVFDTVIESAYRDLPYAAALAIEKSLAVAMQEHTARLFALGDAKASK